MTKTFLAKTIKKISLPFLRFSYSLVFKRYIDTSLTTRYNDDNEFNLIFIQHFIPITFIHLEDLDLQDLAAQLSQQSLLNSAIARLVPKSFRLKINDDFTIDFFTRH